MTTLTTKSLLTKYQDIIKEEVNVKEVRPFAKDISITKIFKPLGSQLSEKFGKDTGKIIQYGKQGNIKELDDGRVTIFDDAKNERTLEKNDYEIAYEGLDSDDMAIDGEIIAKLDLHITPELQREGTAREISRFLNQMRKEADFNIDDRVQLTFMTEDKELASIMKDFADFFQKEALIKESKENKKKLAGDIVALFESDGKTIEFALKR
ncbi:MAG: DUF5915 domain-containing protein [Candidatus Absconditabacterales bacterium]|jgi:isoleucyl-tRNA synthetase